MQLHEYSSHYASSLHPKWTTTTKQLHNWSYVTARQDQDSGRMTLGPDPRGQKQLALMFVLTDTSSHEGLTPRPRWPGHSRPWLHSVARSSAVLTLWQEMKATAICQSEVTSTRGGVRPSTVIGRWSRTQWEKHRSDSVTEENQDMSAPRTRQPFFETHP